MPTPTTPYDVLIVGSGPIAATTAYFLTRGQPRLRIGLISQDEPNDRTATYRYAGGSVRWYWDDPEKIRLTSETADFLRELTGQGVDLALIETQYYFVHRGIVVPSLNISGSKLVTHLLNQAAQAGLERQTGSVRSFKKIDDQYHLDTSLGEISARRVLLAVGPSIQTLWPAAPFAFEKRQLFVLDTPITPERSQLPHTIVPVGDGLVYFFRKRIGDQEKLLVAQEDVVEHAVLDGPEDYFQELLDQGLGTVAPYLRDARVGQILWGLDATNKLPIYHTTDNKLFAVACGSAVRSCVGIGRRAAELLTAES